VAANYNGQGMAAVDKPEPREISGLLLAWAAGDQNALDRLAPLVYPRLRAIARRHLRSGGPAQTLQTTALVNEAFLHLVGSANAEFDDRDRFFAFAAQVMRRIVIDEARARLAQKRGAGAERADADALDQIPAVSSDRSEEFLALEDALLRLEQIDARKAKVIELRFFAGLSVEESAAVLKVSPQTVMRDWRMARVWLARELRTASRG
jgi:RNA polymerase sigma factor (TIGR02999 family)